MVKLQTCKNCRDIIYNEHHGYKCSLDNEMPYDPNNENKCLRFLEGE